MGYPERGETSFEGPDWEMFVPVVEADSDGLVLLAGFDDDYGQAPQTHEEL